MCNQVLSGLSSFNYIWASIYKWNICLPCIISQALLHQKVCALTCPYHLAPNYQCLDTGSLVWYMDCMNGSNLYRLLWLCPSILVPGLTAWLSLANGTIADQMWAKAWKGTCITSFLVLHCENMPRLSWRRAESSEVRPSKTSQPRPTPQPSTDAWGSSAKISWAWPASSEITVQWVHKPMLHKSGYCFKPLISKVVCLQQKWYSMWEEIPGSGGTWPHNGFPSLPVEHVCFS